MGPHSARDAAAGCGFSGRRVQNDVPTRGVGKRENRMKKFLMVWVLVLCGGVFAGSAEGARERTSLVREASYEDDEDNCGAEGYVCAAGRECIDYKCTPAWLEIEDMGAPDERHSAAAGMLGGKFVVFGGCSTTSGDYPALSSSGVYDPAMD